MARPDSLIIDVPTEDWAIVQLEADRGFADVSQRASDGVQPGLHVLARTPRSARMEPTRHTRAR
jgi:hypothetical protein